MNCNEYENLITDYLENSLPPSDQARVESHMAQCKNCREQAEREKAVMEQLNEISIEECPNEIMERVINSIPATKISLKERIRTWLMPGHFTCFGKATFAGSLAIVLIALFICIPDNQKQTLKVAEYSPEEIRQATVEAKLALAYFAVYSHKTETALKKIDFYEPVIKPFEKEFKKALGKIPYII